MKSFKKLIAEAFDKKPKSKADLKKMLKATNMEDWYDFLVLVWAGFDQKDLMSFQFNTPGKGKGVSGKTLGLKIQPGEFYKLTMAPDAEKYRKKIFKGVQHKVNTSGSEPKLELSKTMKWKGEEYDYSLDVIAGLGSNAAKGPDGAQWESIITHQVNILKGTGEEDTAAEAMAVKFYPDYLPQAEALGKAFVKELGISSTMTQFGAGSATTSKIWKNRGASNTTPKTDMYTKNYNISLKKDGGSQLASGTSAETLAMFDAALAYMGETGSPVIKKIMKDIDTGFKSVTIDFNKTEMETMTGGGTAKGTSVQRGKLKKKKKDGSYESLPKEKQDEFKKYTETEEFHKQLNKKLFNTFEKVADNQDFVKWFCFEAMSGYKKFEGEKLARASTCVTFNPDSGTVSRVDVTANGKAKGLSGTPTVGKDLEKKAKKVKIYAAWKSSGKNPYSSLRVAFKNYKTKDIVDDANESVDVNCTIDSIIRDQILLDEDVKSLGLNLTEEIVQLDEFALLKSVFNKIKNVGKNATKWLQGFFAKVFEHVKKVLNIIAKLGGKMFEVLFRFLGIEVDKVTTNVPSDIDYFFNK